MMTQSIQIIRVQKTFKKREIQSIRIDKIQERFRERETTRVVQRLFQNIYTREKVDIVAQLDDHYLISRHTRAHVDSSQIFRFRQSSFITVFIHDVELKQTLTCLSIQQNSRSRRTCTFLCSFFLSDFLISC